MRVQDQDVFFRQMHAQVDEAKEVEKAKQDGPETNRFSKDKTQRFVCRMTQGRSFLFHFSKVVLQSPLIGRKIHCHCRKKSLTATVTAPRAPPPGRNKPSTAQPCGGRFCSGASASWKNSFH